MVELVLSYRELAGPFIQIIYAQAIEANSQVSFPTPANSPSLNIFPFPSTSRWTWGLLANNRCTHIRWPLVSNNDAILIVQPVILTNTLARTPAITRSTSFSPENLQLARVGGGGEGTGLLRLEDGVLRVLGPKYAIEVMLMLLDLAPSSLGGPDATSSLPDHGAKITRLSRPLRSHIAFRCLSTPYQHLHSINYINSSHTGCSIIILFCFRIYLRKSVFYC